MAPGIDRPSDTGAQPLPLATEFPDSIPPCRGSSQGLAAVREFGSAKVRSGSKCEELALKISSALPLLATEERIGSSVPKPMRRGKERLYSITSSVWASNVGEIVRPSAFAVFTLIAT